MRKWPKCKMCGREIGLEKKLIAEFKSFLRTLHDHTFNPLKSQENLKWIRFEIEEELKRRD